MISPDEGDSQANDLGALTETAPQQDSEPVYDSEIDGGQDGISAPEKEEKEETAEESDERWTETKTSGIKYINTDKIYSRADALEGSEKIKLYRLNDAVRIAAITDTHYYKIESGEFIHEDYISEDTSKLKIGGFLNLNLRDVGIFSSLNLNYRRNSLCIFGRAKTKNHEKNKL